jgi:hypothetical protein
MRAAAIKYLYWDELYNVRQTAIITGASEDYVRKVIKGERAKGCAASFEDINDSMLARKQVIDKVMSLKGAFFVDGTQKYNYISLLAYLGYNDEELRAIFPLDNNTFMSVAAHRSGQAWREFDSTLIGITEEDYRKTFIDEPEISAAAKAVIEEDKREKEMAEWRRKQRKEQKMATRKEQISRIRN